MRHPTISSSTVAAAAFALGALFVAGPAGAVTHKAVPVDAKAECGSKDGCKTKKGDKHPDSKEGKEGSKKAPKDGEHKCSAKPE